MWIDSRETQYQKLTLQTLYVKLSFCQGKLIVPQPNDFIDIMEMSHNII